MGRLGAAAIAVGCGTAGAALYLAVLLGSPGALILVYLTQLPLFVAGLWLGTSAAALAGIAACVVMLIASDLIATLLFVALNAGPVVLLVRQALLARQGDRQLHWYPPGMLTAWLTGIALAGFAAALLILGGPEGLQTALRDIVARVLDRLAAEKMPQRDEIAATLATVIPGVIAMSWMVMAVINGCLAQGLLVRFGVNWRPSPDIVALSLPPWMTILLGLATVAILFGGSSRFVGLNTLIALFVPFCLAGLAVVHAAARRLRNPIPALVGFYTLAGLFGWPLFVAALLGLLENWIGLRRRLIPSGGDFNG
jgi:hypothetical protein